MIKNTLITNSGKLYISTKFTIFICLFLYDIIWIINKRSYVFIMKYKLKLKNTDLIIFD